MTKEQAKQLVKKVFDTDFDKERFRRFVKEVLNTLDEGKAFHVRGHVPEIFKPHVKTYERLGTYTDPNGDKLDVLVVYLAKDTSLDRARTAQRNFIARYLKDRGQKDAGLIAFVSPDKKDWRFSFVKMEYRLEQQDKEKVKVKEEFTPARRYSFLVGVHENSHTAQSQLLPLLQDDEHNPTLEQIGERFSIEKVTKEFYDRYKKLFLWVQEELDRIKEDSEAVRSDFDEKGVDTADFAKKLLGQIVFLYFLQKKGWFGVERGKDWGTGPKNFLRQLFEKAHNHKKNYFNDYLEPLFYDALAVDRSHIDHWVDQFQCRIPFLNGGLFDPLFGYDWVNTQINLPNEIFTNEDKTKEGDVGTGILDILDRYNFTVREDEPLEKEVVVDPEMLGRVFENLLEVKDRKSKGTYYTPREIVHYMCQESLINYLAMELQSEVKREDIETLIRYGETAVEHDSRVVAKGEETDRYSYKLPKPVRDHAAELDKALASIKVCDPAIGSGAFPVGMMNEIVRTRNALTSYLPDKKTPYDFKREAIQESLYGVDIDPGAVEIAKLRLWLSLIVDEEDIKEIRPLPNLDYKIMQGNSLLEEFEGIKLFDGSLLVGPGTDKDQLVAESEEERSKLQRDYFKLNREGKLTNIKKADLEKELTKLNRRLSRISREKHKRENGDEVNRGLFDEQSQAQEKLTELKRLHDEFFKATLKAQKDELRKRIDELDWEFIETSLKEQGKLGSLKKVEKLKQKKVKPFFLWRLNFAEVFEKKGGFDVVIANPPYVKESVNKKVFDGTRDSECYQGKMDLWYLFGCKGLDLLKGGGVICFIAINNWVSNDGASKFRNKVITQGRIINFMDFGNYKIFSAGIQTMVFVIVKNQRPSKYTLNYGKLIDDSVDSEILDSFLRERGEMTNKGFCKFTVNFERSVFLDQYINFIPPEVNSVLEKAKEQNVFYLKDHEIFSGIDVMQDFVNKNHQSKLGKKYEIRQGIFVLSTDEKNTVRWNRKEIDLLKPYFTTKEINRYLTSNKNTHWIIYSRPEINKRIDDYPNIKRHLDQYKKVITSVNKPYGLHRTREEKIFLGEKILSIRKCAQPSFSYVDFPAYVSRAFLIIKTDEADLKYISGVLNSKLIAFWLFYKGKLQGNLFQIDKTPIMNIPILIASQRDQKEIASLVGRIMITTRKRIHSESFTEQEKLHSYEKQIDQLVYKLYSLTPEEIGIVENQP